MNKKIDNKTKGNGMGMSVSLDEIELDNSPPFIMGTDNSYKMLLEMYPQRFKVDSDSVHVINPLKALKTD